MGSPTKSVSSPRRAAPGRVDPPAGGGGGESESGADPAGKREGAVAGAGEVRSSPGE